MARRLVLSFFGVAALTAAATAAEATRPDPRDWSAITEKARGQSIYWYAWGGSQPVNDYIAWVGGEMQARYGVSVNEVKLGDTAEAVSRVLAEKTAGRDQDGAVDLIWINGPNFAAMKEKGLLYGPFAEALPNWRYVDVEGKPGLRSDFTVPTQAI